MEFSSYYNYRELQSILGAKIKELRLSIGKYSQKQQASAAGIPYSTYRLIEQHGKGSIEDFMKILLSMGRIDTMNMLFEKRTNSVMDNFNEAINEQGRKRIRLREDGTGRQRIKT